MLDVSFRAVTDLTFGTNSHLVLGVVLKETLDTAAGKLEHTTVCQQHSISVDSSFRCMAGIFSCEVKLAVLREYGTRHACFDASVPSSGSLI